MKLVKRPHTPPSLEPSELPAPSSSLATVQIAHVGLCRTDLAVAADKLPLDTPLVLGHECSGWVLHDPSGRFQPGAAVAANPLLPGERFLGLHCDGALQNWLQIHPSQLIDAQGVDLALAAYVEPVAASMAVLKARMTAQQEGVIYHANRISQLTYLILRSFGYNVQWQPNAPSGAESECFDYAIETSFEDEHIGRMLKALRPGGLLVVKSRQYAPRTIVAGHLVSKELTLQAVNYYDFNLAMDWLRQHAKVVEPLLGETYPLARWSEAFDAALAGDAQKVFIRVNG